MALLGETVQQTSSPFDRLRARALWGGASACSGYDVQYKRQLHPDDQATSSIAGQEGDIAAMAPGDFLDDRQAQAAAL